MAYKYQSGHLTEEGARRVLDLRRQGLSYRAISISLDVTEGTVARVCTGKTWPELSPRSEEAAQ